MVKSLVFLEPSFIHVILAVMIFLLPADDTRHCRASKAAAAKLLSPNGSG